MHLVTTPLPDGAESVRIDGADGGCTIVVHTADYTAVVSVDARTLRRLRDRRLRRGAHAHA
jgi:hypothetical protein